MTSSKRPVQGLADPMRVDRKSGIAEVQHGGGNGFREPESRRRPRRSGQTTGSYTEAKTGPPAEVLFERICQEDGITQRAEHARPQG